MSGLSWGKPICRGSAPALCSRRMDEAARAIAQIEEAFGSVTYPGDWCLRDSNEGEEPFLVTKEFAGKDDWRVLDPAFLDQAPEGWGTALCFFSDEAFRFYLPAYLIADVRGALERVDPVFHLTHGLDDASRGEPINPRRYGGRTWFDHARHKFAMFNVAEVRAIIAYLGLCRGKELYRFDQERIDQALTNYWRQRVRELE